MATLEDVRRIALSLPEVTQHGDYDFKVRGKNVCWERPLRARDIADLEGLGQEVPVGDLLGVRVPREEKDELLASAPDVFLTIPHFDGYPALLVKLADVEVEELTEIITDSWLVQAPKRLAKEFLASGG